MTDEIRKYILGLIQEQELRPDAPDIQRRMIVYQLLIHFPPETENRNHRKRTLRDRLNRALANPTERRGGKRPGAGAPLKNHNQNWEKRRSHK